MLILARTLKRKARRTGKESLLDGSMLAEGKIHCHWMISAAAAGMIAEPNLGLSQAGEGQSQGPPLPPDTHSLLLAEKKGHVENSPLASPLPCPAMVVTVALLRPPLPTGTGEWQSPRVASKRERPSPSTNSTAAKGTPPLLNEDHLRLPSKMGRWSGR